MEAKIKLKTKDTKVKVKAGSLHAALTKLAALKTKLEPVDDDGTE